MKDTYKLYITETLQRECEIEATSEEEALGVLEEKYNNNEIVLDYSDLIDSEFSNCTYTKKEIEILNEIHNFCANECCSCECCPENNCILFRIEQIITNGLKECCICGEKIDGYGNNAEPIKNGECCDKCNDEKVIPVRLKEYGL